MVWGERIERNGSMFSHEPKNKDKTYGEISLDRLRELSKMAFYDLAMDEGCNIPKEEITYPEKTTEFEYQVYYMLKEAVRDGMKLERSINGES